jgi:predicted DNA repair protein MutK
MSDATQAAPSISVIHIAGGIAILSGIISAIGVVLLIGMFVFFSTPNQALGLKFGMLNDICVALQYLLTIPIALALYRILLVYNPALMRAATIIGIAAMLLVVGLQLLLVFGVLTFERQVIWVSLAMILGVGSWLVITGWVARSTGRLPNSLLMSILAVPYVGYPVWAFWLGQQLLGW